MEYLYISTQTNCKLHCQTNCHPMEYLKLETNCWKLKLVTGWATSSSALSAIKKPWETGQRGHFHHGDGKSLVSVLA